MKPALLTRPAEVAFGKELRAARLHAKMSKTGLARGACMTRQGLEKIERGEGVTLGTIVLLANALGCQIADLFPRKSPWHA
jgi:transcriptional regulator with XRE-family HTH domain